MKDSTSKLNITFYSKQKIICPVCQTAFEKEELLSGGGRLIAGDLTDELRRTYEPSAKYGQIYPLIYSIGACPRCRAAFLWSDFDQITGDSLERIKATERERIDAVENIFPHFNLKQERTLFDGAAAYYLALLCYEQVDKKFSPTFKKALISLRLAWLTGDIHKICSDKNYDFIQENFYRKALFFYQESLLYESNGSEKIGSLATLGPDVDKNYAYDGIIYLSSLLEYKYGQTTDITARLKKLDESKRSIARIFGLGKSSKAKPGPLLEKARTLYDAIAKDLKEANSVDFPADDEEEDAE